MNGVMPARRHSLNITSRPTRPLPSEKGWMRSRAQWNLTMSSKACGPWASYSWTSSPTRRGTSPGAAVSTSPMAPPITFEKRLKDPTAMMGFLASEVPALSVRWRRQRYSASTGASQVSRISSNAEKWFLASIMSSTRAVPEKVSLSNIWTVWSWVRVDPSMWLEL